MKIAQVWSIVSLVEFAFFNFILDNETKKCVFHKCMPLWDWFSATAFVFVFVFNEGKKTIWIEGNNYLLKLYNRMRKKLSQKLSKIMCKYKFFF